MEIRHPWKTGAATNGVIRGDSTRCAGGATDSTRPHRVRNYIGGTRPSDSRDRIRPRRAPVAEYGQRCLRGPYIEGR
jgi:hypothetical protein